MHSPEQSGDAITAPVQAAGDEQVLVVSDGTRAPSLFETDGQQAIANYNVTVTQTEPLDLDPYTADTRAVKNAEFLGADSSRTDAVRIARWDSAYTGPPNYNVRNGPAPSNHFIDRDPERFYTRIRDCAADADPTARDSITATVATQSPNGSDAPTELTLTETDTSSGTFRSEAQMLVTQDFYIPDVSELVIGTLTPRQDSIYRTDDNFAAHDGDDGFVADDNSGDRTHRARAQGDAITEYDFGGSAALADSAAVCATDSIRTLKVRPVLFNEPFVDEGYVTASGDTVGAGNGTFDFADTNGNGTHDKAENSEKYFDYSSFFELYETEAQRYANYNPGLFARGPRSGSVANDGRGPAVPDSVVNKAIERANVHWSQACVKVEKSGPIEHQDVPRNSKGESIMGDNDFTNNVDDRILFDARRGNMKTDVATAYFGASPVQTPSGDEARGLATAPYPDWSPQKRRELAGDKYSYAVLSYNPSPSISRTNLATSSRASLTRRTRHTSCFRRSLVLPIPITESISCGVFLRRRCKRHDR